MTTMDFLPRTPAERLPVSPPGRQEATRATVVQRSVGNDYLQRSSGCAEPAKKPVSGGCTGGCGGCAMRAQVQAMLRVGPAGDAAEQEADDVARRVTSGATAAVERLPGGGAGATTVSLPASTGRPLSPATRAFMEPRFGADFGDVRVHTGTAAGRAAAGIEARAFTHDRDVYLAHGESEHDHRLMAHELTHVVQQGGDTIRRAPTDKAPKANDKAQQAPDDKPLKATDFGSITVHYDGDEAVVRGDGKEIFR